MEENNFEEKEVLIIEMKDKYMVYDYSTGETKSYTANNRQGQKFRAVKFFKDNNAVNYLGTRSITKEYLKKNDSSKEKGDVKEEKTFIFIVVQAVAWNQVVRSTELYHQRYPRRMVQI